MKTEDENGEGKAVKRFIEYRKKDRNNRQLLGKEEDRKERAVKHLGITELRKL